MGSSARGRVFDRRAVDARAAAGTRRGWRPPHRSVRAGLLHTAPTLDAWRQSARSDAGAESWRWEASDDQTQKPSPGHRPALAPAPKRAEPAPKDLSSEGIQTVHVARHRVVVEPALDNRAQPLPELRDWLVPAMPKLRLQRVSFAERRLRMVWRLTMNRPVFRSSRRCA